MPSEKTPTDRNHPPICDYEGSTYQTDFWDQGGRDYEDQVEAIALNRLLPKSGEILLEIGAGAGRNTTRYKNIRRIVLLDYSLTQLQQAQSQLGRNNRYVYVAADAYRLPFVPGLFDVATMIRVLHHISDGPEILKQIRDVLSPGAIFILEFANKKNLKAILRYVLGQQSWNPFDPNPIEFVKLHYNFHPGTTRDWLQETGFEIEKQLTVSHFRIPVLKRLLPTNFLIALDSLFQWTGNWWQLTPSVFLQCRLLGKSSLDLREKASNQSPHTIFRCLNCGNSVFECKIDELGCQFCGTRWEIIDGIYNFKEPIQT